MILKSPQKRKSQVVTENYNTRMHNNKPTKPRVVTRLETKHTGKILRLTADIRGGGVCSSRHQQHALCHTTALLRNPSNRHKTKDTCITIFHFYRGQKEVKKSAWLTYGKARKVLNFQTKTLKSKASLLISNTAHEGCDLTVKWHRSHPQLTCVNTWPQVLTLFGKVVEYLGSRTALEQMDPCVWHLRLYG